VTVTVTVTVVSEPVQVVTELVASQPGEPDIHPVLNTARVGAVGGASLLLLASHLPRRRLHRCRVQRGTDALSRLQPPNPLLRTRNFF
jgi:hypothetical protein